MVRVGVSGGGCTLESVGRWEDGGLRAECRVSQEFVSLLLALSEVCGAADWALSDWSVSQTVYLRTLPKKKACISGLLMAASHSSP